MSRLLFALSAAVVMALAASPAWAPRGPQWRASPNAADAPRPPAPVGECKKDHALISRCRTAWRACENKASDRPTCSHSWVDCCERKPAQG
jgi:hypothetical protein